MKEKMKKFGAWLLAAALAFAGAGAAQAETKQVATQEELNAAVAAADTGDTVEIVKADTYTFPNLPKNITLSCCDGVIFNCVGSGSISSVPNGCTVIGGEFNFGTSSYHGWQHAGFIQIKNAVLNGLFFSYGNMEFTECTFNSPGTEYCMWCYAGNVMYLNCTVNCQGKFANVYNEGNGTWVVKAEGCTFNSTKANKAMLNIKENCCNGAELHFDVTITDCKASGLYPDPSGDDSSALFIGGPLWQVDDRTASTIQKSKDGTGVKVTVDGVVVYGPVETAPAEVEVVTPTVSEEKGITQEIVEQIAANPEVAKVEDTGLKAALAEYETLKDAEAVVKVELTKAAKDETGVLTFEIKPVVKGETETDISDKVVGKPITFRVPLTDAFTKFAKVTHKGEVDEISHVEVQGLAGSRYVELTFNHFSEVEFDPELSFPGLPETAVKVADGFYQSGATYGESSDFYIVNKAGLEYFRDFINNLNGEANAYKATSAGNGFDLTGIRFENKTINLLADIDLNNEIWAPIGITTNPSDGKTEFGGTFDGNNHVISNLKTVSEVKSGNAAKCASGLFGYSQKAFTIKNLTLKNVDITGYTYVGALISTASSEDAKIINCHVKGAISIVATSSFAGCIVGHGYCSVTGCSVEMTSGNGITVNGDGIRIGGIYGYAAKPSISITDCSVSGLTIKILKNYIAGGIVGSIEGGATVSGCSVKNLTIASQRGPYVGYIVGNLASQAAVSPITDCTVANSTLTANVDKFTEKAETYNVQNGDHDCPNAYYVGSGVAVDANGKVTGGTFEYLPDALIADGYTKVAQGTTPETWTVQKKAAAVAKVGDAEFETLAEAVNAVKENETIQLLAGTIEEGEITLPDTIKNITLKGAADHASILKNTTLAHRTNGKSWEGLTIEGIDFESSSGILIVGWGAGNCFKNVTIKDNIFRNFVSADNNAPIHFNVGEKLDNIVISGNLIDGVSGSSTSGICFTVLDGSATISGNTIKNVTWDAIQAVPKAGAEVTITGNTFDFVKTNQKRGIHLQSDMGVDYSATIKNNVFLGALTESSGGALEVYYFADPDKMDVSGNYY